MRKKSLLLLHFAAELGSKGYMHIDYIEHVICLGWFMIILQNTFCTNFALTIFIAELWGRLCCRILE